jgi:uncharacterized phage infection (PIP) family protein YhgE
VKIPDSTRPMRRILSVLGHVISQRSDRSFRCFALESPSLHACFCWALIVSVSLLMVSGCGRYKEELEGAKQQIEKLNAEVRKLTETADRLTQEKIRLDDDLKTLSDKKERMQGELDDLNKGKASLFAENKEIKKKKSEADEEIASLKSEKARLVNEIEELKNRVADLAPPPISPAPVPVPTEVGPGSAKQREEPNPCDAVVAFMKASEAIVRQQKGTERTKSLEQVKQQYAPRMKGAPAKAIKAAEDWVKEGSKLWDQSSSDTVFRLLQLKNSVLEACGKSTSGAEF